MSAFLRRFKFSDESYLEACVLKSCLILVFFLLRAGTLRAAQLPSLMNDADLARATAILGGANAVRLMRSAESYRSFPGLKLGLELGFIPTHELARLGAGNGSLPDIYPAPRLFLAKGLFRGIELILGLFPFETTTSPWSLGGALKWTVQPEDEAWLAVALYGSFTSSRFFSGQLSAQAISLGLVLSKDYVRVKPYLGVGVQGIFGVAGTGIASGNASTGLIQGLQAFVGMEFELPVNLTVEVGFLDGEINLGFLAGFRAL